MTNLYTRDEKAVRELHDTIVRDILFVLHQRGYRTGTVTSGCTFELAADSIVINGTPTDRIDINTLLTYLKEAYNTTPNIPTFIPTRKPKTFNIGS